MDFIQTASRKGIFLGLAFIIMGIGLLVVAVMQMDKINNKKETYIETTATVVAYAHNTNDLEAIIVEYQVDGNSYRKQSNTYSIMPKAKGAKVQVKYNPNDPSDAIFVHDSSNIVFPLVGIVFILAGIFAFIRGIRSMND